MRRTLTTTLGALAATASLALAANSFAQITSADVIVPSGPTEQFIVPTELPTGHIEGRVADIAPTGDSSTMIRLEDGTRLIVLASAYGPEVPPRPGDIVKASYLELEGEKVVTTLQAEVDFQAP